MSDPYYRCPCCGSGCAGPGNINRWGAFSEDELRELNDAGFFLQETEAELIRRAGGAVTGK